LEAQQWSNHFTISWDFCLLGADQVESEAVEGEEVWFEEDFGW
jgi:hypothetical protein